MAFDDSKYKDPDRGWREFARWEIMPAGPWVPNPKDRIFDEDNGFWIVDTVDYSTGLSTLRKWNPPEDPAGDADDLIVGVGPGYSSESYRVFLDQSTTPFTLSPDFRLHGYSRNAAYYRVFLDADISEEYGKVISTMYDSSGNFLGDTVPLIQIDDPQSPTGTSVWLSEGYTSEKMDNGQLVTIVFYNADGGQLSQAQCLIHNSAAVRRADASKKYVQALYLDSPYISSADRQVVEFPVNATVESLPLTAVVQYSDGTHYRSTIDNNRVFLWGLENYIATEPGQEFDMTLAYQLASDEISYNMTPSTERRITASYIARSVQAKGAFNCKLFVYPVWVNAAQGYRLEFWMYNIDRQLYYNVTPYMELGSNSNPFDPKAYGVVQTMTWALDINKVDGRFPIFRKVQVIQLALLNSGDNQQANWEIHFTPDQAAAYGRGLVADMEYVNVNYYKLHLANGAVTQAQWLDKMFYAAQPLYNTDTESEAPTPTHFIVQTLHNEYEFAVSQWGADLVVNNDLADGELLYIRWIRRTYDSDLQLAITAVPVAIRD